VSHAGAAGAGIPVTGSSIQQQQMNQQEIMDREQKMLEEMMRQGMGMSQSGMRPAMGMSQGMGRR
jgi:hypothetical protein